MKQQQDAAIMMRVLALAERSYAITKQPFAAILVHEDGREIPAMSAPNDPLGHPEAMAIKEAVRKWGANLEDATLYTSFEPCPMCSFLVRDFNVGRVVYCLPSPHWGGGDRWPILYSIIDERYNAAGETTVPDVYGGCLINIGEEFFDRIGWTMHKAPHHE